MIKAIFYSKFDTQEGRASREALLLLARSNTRVKAPKSSIKFPTEPSSPHPRRQGSPPS